MMVKVRIDGGRWKNVCGVEISHESYTFKSYHNFDTRHCEVTCHLAGREDIFHSSREIRSISDDPRGPGSVLSAKESETTMRVTIPGSWGSPNDAAWMQVSSVVVCHTYPDFEVYHEFTANERVISVCSREETFRELRRDVRPMAGIARLGAEL